MRDTGPNVCREKPAIKTKRTIEFHKARIGLAGESATPQVF